MGLEGKDVFIEVDDRDAVYPVVIDPLIESMILTASDAEVGDFFGISVSVSGDTAIVGAHQADDAPGCPGGTCFVSGAAYIFDRDSDGMGGVLADNWGEVKILTASDAEFNNRFGISVSISGDTVIVGAHQADDAPACGGACLSSGAAYIFERDEGGMDNWGEVKILTASDAEFNNRFGFSASISGDTIIVSANRANDAPGCPGGTCSDSGAAYIFDTPVSVNITKVTIPSGGMDFDFTSTGFTGFLDCDITDAFMLDDMQTASCEALPGGYSITEIIPDDQVLTVFCEELPAVSSIDSLAGTLEFTITAKGANVDCLFINSFTDTVVRVTDEPEGANCEFGGTKLETGLDTNQNGVLDDEEVDQTDYICDGEPGSLVKITDEPAGANCEFGGQKIETGIDDNQNGVLDDEEVDDTSYVCNGEPGDDGQDGDDGDNGDDGFNTVEDINIEPPGENCANGGFRFDKGLDLNRNGVLDSDEVDESLTMFSCNGVDGEDGTDSSSGCAVAGSGDNTDGVIGLAAMMIIPVMFVFTWRFRRRCIIEKNRT